MEIITNKKYRVNKIQKIFSCGISRNGMTIKNGVLKENSFGGEEITVSQIKSIEYVTEKYYQNGVPVYQNGYQFTYTYKGRDIPMTHVYKNILLSANSWRELLNDLAKINPEIMVSYEVDMFMNKEFIEPYQWKFDFEKYYEDKQLEKNALIEQEYTYLPILEMFFGLFIIIPILFLLPLVTGFLGNDYFSKTIGEEYFVYKNVCLVVASLFFTFCIINLLSALFSKYLGHKLTIILAILGVICTILAFVL